MNFARQIDRVTAWQTRHIAVTAWIDAAIAPIELFRAAGHQDQPPHVAFLNLNPTLPDKFDVVIPHPTVVLLAGIGSPGRLRLPLDVKALGLGTLLASHLRPENTLRQPALAARSGNRV